MLDLVVRPLPRGGVCCVPCVVSVHACVIHTSMALLRFKDMICLLLCIVRSGIAGGVMCASGKGVVDEKTCITVNRENDLEKDKKIREK